MYTTAIACMRSLDISALATGFLDMRPPLVTFVYLSLMDRTLHMGNGVVRMGGGILLFLLFLIAVVRLIISSSTG